MTLPQLFKFLTFLMVLLGTLSLLIFGHYSSSPGTGMLVLVAMFAGLFFWESKVHTPLWELAWKVVAVVVVVYVIGDIVAGPLDSAETRVVKHAANLSIFLHLFKIYNRKTARDYKQIYLISFFQFVSCTTLTTSFGFYLLFSLYVVVALWTLSLFHIRNQIERHKAYRYLPRASAPSGSELFGRALGSSATVSVRSILGPGYFAMTFVVAVGILLMSLGMFFLLPRKGVAGLGRFQLPHAVSGLSGEVDLDRFGRISQDDEIVMEVALPGVRQVPDKVLWHAGSLSYFDGQVWRKTPPGIFSRDMRYSPRVRPPECHSYNVPLGEVPQLYQTMPEEEFATRTELWEQRVSVQPGHAVFLISATRLPVHIESPIGFTLEEINTVRFTGSPPGPISYTVFSEHAMPSERQLQRAGFVTEQQDRHGEITREYLRAVPLSDKSLAVLRDEIKIADHATPYEKIMAIQQFLEDNFVYTLDIQRPERGVDVIENFLVHTRQGHCEYFASAMALMLKECGIPSRLVFGYVSTSESWNRFLGGSFVIRERDAHAWVEAALVIDGKVQWVPFDPSPRQATSSVPRSFLGRFFYGVGRFFEALKARWHESVVAFDRSYQNRIAARLETMLTEMRRAAMVQVRDAGRSVRWIWHKLTRTRATMVLTPLALACLLSAGALLLARRIRRRVRFRRAYVQSRPERPTHSVRFYERMLKLLLQHDIVKPAEQTPSEFAASLAGRGELAPAVGGLTELYYRVRFGHTQLTGKQIRWVHEALGRLRRALLPRRQAATGTGQDQDANPLDTPGGAR
jgi:transglutaminase-like putative cysteine protease